MHISFDTVFICRWILKCHACYTLTAEIGRIFCPKCGNGGTLRKVAVTVGENGIMLAARRPRITLRGTKVCIPWQTSSNVVVLSLLSLKLSLLGLIFTLCTMLILWFDTNMPVYMHRCSLISVLFVCYFSIISFLTIITQMQHLNWVWTVFSTFASRWKGCYYQKPHITWRSTSTKVSLP